MCNIGDNVFFTSFLDKEISVQEIFSFDIKNKKLLRKKTISQYGQFMPAITDQGKLIYCEKEFNKTSLAISGDFWKDLFYECNSLLSLKKINQSGNGILDYTELLDKNQNEQYIVEDFRPHYKIFNFHSWFPLYLNPYVTATFLSRDYLDRLHLNLTTGLNLNDKSFYLSTEMEYGEFYPVISLSMDNIFNQEGAIRNNETGVIEKYRFNSIKLSSSIGIPLTFQKLNNRTSILPEIAVNAFRNYNASDGIHFIEQFRIDLKLNISNIKLQSLRSVVPEKSSFFNIRIYNIQDPGDYFGATFNYTYYLPSFFTNHSWDRIGGLYNSSEIPSLKFADVNSSFYYARGYSYNAERKSLGGIKVNYSFPVFYPDFAISKFIFFKRIRANIFFDMDRYNVIDETSWKNQRSAGLEFIFDNVYLRMFEIPIGFGFDYLMDVPDKDKRFNFRLLLGF